MRFLTTSRGVAFAVMLVIVQVGDLPGDAGERLDHDRAARRRPLGDGAGTRRTSTSPTRSPSRTCSASGRCPGVLRADNLIVWFVTVALPSGAKEATIVYALEDFRPLGLPLERGRRRSAGPAARPVRAARRFGGPAVRPVRGGRPSRVHGAPAQDHRADPRGPLVHDQPDRVPRLSRGAGDGPAGAAAADDVHPREARPGRRRRGGARGDPPQAAVQRRPDPGRVGRAVPGLLGREHRAGPEHVHDRLPRLPGRRRGGRADVVHGDDRAFQGVRDGQGHRGDATPTSTGSSPSRRRSPPWPASSWGPRWPTASGR